MTAPGILRDVIVPLPVAGDLTGGQPVADGVRGDLILRGGRVAGMRAAPPGPDPRIVAPALVEAHCHLDKCHTIDRMQGIGGDLAAAIAAQAADMANWSAEDLRRRTARGMDEARVAGCAVLRSHVDWTESACAPLAWSILAEVAADRPDIVLDRAALVGVGVLAQPGMADAIAVQVARTGGTLGCFVLDQPDRAAGVRAAFAAADRLGLALDFHVDEGLAPGLDGLEIIADIALETGFMGPVLCGHACSLMNRTGADLARLLEKLARAGIAVCALPATNLYLQGRCAGTPDRRGLTRLGELRAAGVTVLVGSDNVADAFCPAGAHDPMAALHLAVLSAHLDPPFDRWLPMITTDAARALGRTPVTVAGAAAVDLRISPATSLSGLVAGRFGPPVALPPQLEPFAA